MINDWQGALYREFFFCNQALLASLALEQGRIDRVQFIIMMVHEKHPLVIHLVPSSPSFTKWMGAGEAALASFTGWQIRQIGQQTQLGRQPSLEIEIADPSSMTGLAQVICNCVRGDG